MRRLSKALASVRYRYRYLVPLDASIPPSVREALLAMAPTDLHSVSGPDDERLDAYTLLRDVAGAPALILRVSLPREITQRAAYVNRLSLLWFLVQGAVSAFWSWSCCIAR